MATLNIKVNNLDAVLKKVDNITKKFEAAAEQELNGWADQTATLAKLKSPVDEGHLAGSINANHVAKSGFNLTAGVTVAVNYAAYVEFGTKKFAAAYVSSLPQDWQTFAASYKGSAGGGSFEDFVMRLTRWVRLKGIGATYNIKTRRRDRIGRQTAQQTIEADAYAIALYIIRHGIKPHPFLFPSYVKTVAELKKNLKSLVK